MDLHYYQKLRDVLTRCVRKSVLYLFDSYMFTVIQYIALMVFEQRLKRGTLTECQSNMIRHIH